MIISRTPFRISFFGGGTDYPAWYREHGGAVLSTTFNRYAYISCRYLPPFFQHKYRVVYSKIETVQSIQDIQHPSVKATLDYCGCHEKGLEIHYDGDLPARSGLGSSSAFTVGLLNAVNALQGNELSAQKLSEEALHVEQDLIKETVGSQDQIAVATGGFNKIIFQQDGNFLIEPVNAKQERLDALNNHLMLFFTGFSRMAEEVAKSKIDNFDQKKAELHQMHAMVDEGLSILQNNAGSLDDFGRLLDQSWQLKRSLSDKVATTAIDDIYAAAKKAGALGGKLLGAGGGGFMLLYVKPEQQDQVRKALEKLLCIPFSFEQEGSKIVVYHPSGL